MSVLRTAVSMLAAFDADDAEDLTRQTDAAKAKALRLDRPNHHDLCRLDAHYVKGPGAGLRLAATLTWRRTLYI